ncbi:MAG: LysR family transcriptional regulator [Anaerolineales bacterium]|nr:LysR family transcriptional regulator [Xanthobacteraceae bacterium]MCW5796319.1 LysR family transcriptional regulator [Nitrospira sp.]MCW5886525.1 LysR family transcriptional regulator [Anaerolineales bacterium]
MAKHRRSIEFRHLRYVVAAAEHGSFRKAGIALERSPAAVSRCIADLEDEIGSSLFHRHTWGVSLTYAGERFLRSARKAIRVIGEGATDVGSVGRSENGRVRIGIYSSIASGFLAELLRAYGERHSRVRVELIDGNPDEHVAAIRQLSLDVAFITGTRDWPDCDRTPLWSERIFAVLPDHHRLAARSELAWQDLTTEPFVVSEVAPGHEIHDHLVRELAELGPHPQIQVQSVGRDNLLPLVAIGRELTLVSEAMIVAQFPGVTYRPILGELLSFSAVWTAKNDNPAFRRLLSMAKAMSANGQGRRSGTEANHATAAAMRAPS